MEQRHGTHNNRANSMTHQGDQTAHEHHNHQGSWIADSGNEQNRQYQEGRQGGEYHLAIHVALNYSVHIVSQPIYSGMMLIWNHIAEETTPTRALYEHHKGQNQHG